MRHNRKAASFLWLIILIISLPGGSVVYAQGYPPPSDYYVNDYAKILSATDAERIGGMLDDLEYKTGIEMVVVTIESIHDYGTGDDSIESFATSLFNEWGIGHKKENNGILLLMAVKDRKVRIELGGGYGRQYDAAMKDVIDHTMIPYFKNNEYSRGLYEGSQEVIKKVTKEVSWFSYYKWHLLLVVLIIVCIAAGISCMKSGKRGWGWALFAAAGVLLIFLIKMLLSGKSSSGFGGGSSFGGGASGSW